MAAIGTVVGRILAQIGEADPVEVGSFELPIHFETNTEPVKRETPPSGPSGVSRAR